MKLGYELTIEQTQKLALTPELIQAIKILQFNNTDLFEYVQNELMENPILEETKSESESGEAAGILEISDIRERALEDDRDDLRTRQWESSPEKDEMSFEKFTHQEETLEDHLMDQLYMTKCTDEESRAAEFIIEALDDNGYLTMSLEDVAGSLNVPLETAMAALAIVQSFEPSGVGARNLEECLLIQLWNKGLLTDDLERIVTEKLSDVADNHIQQIARAIGKKPEEVQSIVDTIKTLEPKPGRQYAAKGETTRYVIPDVLVEKENDEYVVRSNDDSIPKLRVSSYYDRLSKTAREDKELEEYLSKRLSAATWLIRSIEQRKQTIYNVAQAIVNYQRDFFEHGDKSIKTLTLKQIAEEVGIHESTVSRAINGKYIQSPRGVYELKYFFSSGVSKSGEEEGISSNSVKSMIKEIIDSEDEKKPYSDQIIVSMLENKGIEISRRTVAKYRESMGIAKSSMRRRY